jgi:hypothetical protein
LKKAEKEKKRKLAKAQSERQEDTDAGKSGGDNKPSSTNAGAQFGLNGNRSKKTKSRS